jgi:anti-sigma factor RsiW
MSCQELVELITDYFENALPREERLQFEQHLNLCHGCVNYVEQMRVTVRTVGGLREESVPSEARSALLDAFRDWKRR